MCMGNLVLAEQINSSLFPEPLLTDYCETCNLPDMRSLAKNRNFWTFYSFVSVQRVLRNRPLMGLPVSVTRRGGGLGTGSNTQKLHTNRRRERILSDYTVRGEG